MSGTGRDDARRAAQVRLDAIHAEVGKMAGAAPGRMVPGERRHPALVTRDRLLAAHDRWARRMGDGEVDALGAVLRMLERIAAQDAGKNPETGGAHGAGSGGSSLPAPRQ